MKIPSLPRCEGGNMIVDLDEEDYWKEIKDLKFSVFGKLFLRRRKSIPTVMELKSKLRELWEVDNFKLIPMGGCHYHIMLGS